MSGDNYHYGDAVNIHGGTGHIGIVKNGAHVTPAVPAPSPAALQQAIDELRETVMELRGEVPPASAQAIDDTLPTVTAGIAVRPRDRRNALDVIAAIAATVGTVGQPVIEAVNKILALLGT